MRCIDADALRESLDIDVFDCFKCKHGVSIYGYCSRGREFQKACNEIEFAQTIDVAPVVHGQWIPKEKADTPYGLEMECAKCGFSVIVNDALYFKFCPNCGAKMDREGNGNEVD